MRIELPPRYHSHRKIGAGSIPDDKELREFYGPLTEEQARELGIDEEEMKEWNQLIENGAIDGRQPHTFRANRSETSGDTSSNGRVFGPHRDRHWRQE